MLGADIETPVKQVKLETVVAGMALRVGQGNAVDVVRRGPRAEAVGLVVEQVQPTEWPEWLDDDAFGRGRALALDPIVSGVLGKRR